ncbi:MAG: hypothetical protein GY749_47085 [Desulfobacteraceae bacterium]|nr:hypothetical protein [Desulfobacteraceae bacterium]
MAGLVYDINKAYKYRSKSFSVFEDLRGFGNPAGLLKDRLKDHFHELDTPMQVEWPGGKREAVLFLFEEETEPGRFSIHRMVRYCTHIGEMMETDRVVPVVIFLKPGSYPSSLCLGGEWNTYLFFRFVTADLGRIPAEEHMNSDNIVARVNLPNMAYDHDKRLDVYARAQEGLVGLEKDFNKRIKYTEFIDYYAKLSEEELIRYNEEYLPESSQKEEIMGFRQMFVEKARKEGRKEGEILTLRRLLSRRFGRIPDWTEECLKKAEQKDLEIWTDRILDAGKLEDVFDARTPH